MIHTQKRIRCVFSIDNSRISFCELISWSSHINSNQILNTSSTGNHYNIIKAPKSIQIKFKFKKKPINFGKITKCVATTKPPPIFFGYIVAILNAFHPNCIRFIRNFLPRCLRDIMYVVYEL